MMRLANRLLCPALFLSAVILTGAVFPNNQIEQQAVSHYRQHHDAGSLRIAAQQVVKGMEKTKVVALLGAPDYSPCDGQDYYGSDAVDDQGRTLVLVVDYHGRDGTPGETVGWFSLDFIGE